jgi:hypothetical protein
VEAPTVGLRARGHQVELLDPAKTDQYDVVVFSKAYTAEHRAMAEAVKRRGGRVVFDLCDNHFYNPYNLPRYRRAREELREMLDLADRVVCSTRTLAEVVRQETDDAIAPIVVGDIVERMKPRKRARTGGEPLRLTWFGSHGSPNAPSGMTDLLLIREHLEALAGKRDVELTVCSNSREKFEQSIAEFRLPTRYVEWSLDGFPRVLANTDAALLPMTINPFTACKTHNRLTTALYAGVPVIASGIESYREFGRYCTLDDWQAGLEALIDAPLKERDRALASRGLIDDRWTIESFAVQWEAALALPTGEPFGSRHPRGLKLQGRLDATARRAVTGWVSAPRHPDLRVQVVLECDGEPVAVAVADQPREDLAAVGLVRDCGFSLPLPPRAAAGDGARLAVRVLDTDWVVGENPILIGDDLGLGPIVAGMASPAPRPVDIRAEQRWDVAAAVREQERALALLEQERSDRNRARTAAAKVALGLGGASAA